MADPQGLFHWPGVDAILPGSRYTDIRGIQPGYAQLYTVPDAYFAHGGTMAMTFGSTRILRVDCKADIVAAQRRGDGTTVFQIKILDRRWKWETMGRISGHYNIREKVGDVETFVEESERTPRQLAELCLKALNETGYDLSEMPNLVRPPVHWDYTRPIKALDEIMQATGATLILRNNARNTIKIIPVAEPPGVRGRPLPQDNNPPGPLVTRQDIAVDPPEIPESIRACVLIKLQVDLELECVAVDLDGSIVSVNDLSYLPIQLQGQTLQQLIDSTGAGRRRDIAKAGVPPEWMNLENLKARDLARQHLLKMYRIKVPFDIPGIGRMRPYRVKRLAEILPIEGLQLAKSAERRLGGNQQQGQNQIVQLAARQPALVYGIWFDEQETHVNVIDKLDPTVIDDLEDVLRSDPRQDGRQTGYYPHGFQLDTERGIVRFSQPVYATEFYDDATGRAIKYVSNKPAEQGPVNAAGNEQPRRCVPAVLRLRTTISIRNPDPRKDYLGWFRYERERPLGGARFGLGPQYEVFDEIGYEVIPTYDVNYRITRTTDNKERLERYLDLRLDEIEAKYQVQEQRSLEYDGFLPIELSPSIRQVEYFIDSTGLAYTRAERNNEDRTFVETEEQRRLRQALREGAEFQRKPPEAAKVRQDGQQIAPQGAGGLQQA